MAKASNHCSQHHGRHQGRSCRALAHACMKEQSNDEGTHDDQVTLVQAGSHRAWLHHPVAGHGGDVPFPGQNVSREDCASISGCEETTSGLQHQGHEEDDPADEDDELGHDGGPQAMHR